MAIYPPLGPPSISSDLKVNNVKKNNLINGLFATLLIASPLAGADQKYPAADFQPQVVFQDNDLIAKSGSASKPAAKVAEASASNEVDAKYPAANFQPQVVYSDPNYKPGAVASAKASKSESVSESAAVETPIESTSVAAAAKEESQSTYLIGLIALGLVGGFLFKGQTKCSGKKAAASPAPAPVAKGGLTGVSRYLNKVSGTGVSRYLEKQVKAAPSTGVAKYLAKQVTVAKSTAAGAATGVEKYMRNRG
jgi:hypothetical protein